MWVVTLHNLFLCSHPPLSCHPPSYWLRLFSSQTFSRINTPTFSTPVSVTEVFRDFSQFQVKYPGYTMQNRSTARIPLPQARWLHLNARQKSLLRLTQSGLKTQIANQPKFIPSTTILSFFVPCILSTYKMKKTNRCHYFNFIHISTDLYMFRAYRPILRIHTAVHTTIGSVAVPFRPRALYTEHAAWTVQPLNSCVNSPEDGPVGPKHVEIRPYMNKIEIVTSIGFSFHTSTTSLCHLGTSH
jgi:hypothetical protein